MRLLSAIATLRSTIFEEFSKYGILSSGTLYCYQSEKMKIRHSPEWGPNPKLSQLKSDDVHVVM